MWYGGGSSRSPFWYDFSFLFCESCELLGVCYVQWEIVGGIGGV